MDLPTLPSDIATSIFDILVKHGGANERYRDNFIQVQSEGCREYRFCGIFGFGGKFWNYDGEWYVNYYSEHQTPECDNVCKTINHYLKELKEGRKCDGSF